jgi:DNA repair protein NreA
MASKPVEMEISLKDKPHFRLNTDTQMAPTGPHAELEKVSIISNPVVGRHVDKVVSDTDLGAADAAKYLYQHEHDENFIAKLLSVGNIGVTPQRKLVPTRWSITATDDILGKQMITQIKDFQEADNQAYFGGYLGNYYLVLFFPQPWSYELFESYLPQGADYTNNVPEYATDLELYAGRKDYAENTVGGYYAARLAILDKLVSMKRQASVLALRFITDEYAIPLGVWVVREATRKAMQAKPLEFASKELMLSYAKAVMKRKFGINGELMLQRSKLLYLSRTQRSLMNFGGTKDE